MCHSQWLLRAELLVVHMHSDFCQILYGVLIPWATTWVGIELITLHSWNRWYANIGNRNHNPSFMEQMIHIYFCLYIHHVILSLDFASQMHTWRDKVTFKSCCECLPSPHIVPNLPYKFCPLMCLTTEVQKKMFSSTVGIETRYL